ncbi:hypothetical protein RBG61_10610 [Paludicola sp. MB14-C6]|uniref:hypothetical protein n=1 Tax=Paludihabitans sp. MB14-C6 TaxID=3070656 RepID=UPI0027DCC763|nr:hypothetical protein [Paludicola sp. MB14-C6]WMJ22433.1 hypothetical protein RBG61_10610 [Paludicola sp. MB14-C6]
MKKLIVNVCLILLVFIMVSCGESASRRLSLEDVIMLSKKGNELSWSDFEKYKSKDIGSGLHCVRYEINPHYYLLIGGPNKDEKPMYIQLVQSSNTDNFIDIRTNDVKSFINKR